MYTVRDSDAGAAGFPLDAPLPGAADGDRRPGVLYPNVYVWFVFLASLDIMCTYLILHPILFHHLPPVVQGSTAEPGTNALFAEPEVLEPRGAEVNAIADWVIERGGVPGKVAFKFTLVMFVVTMCEIVGRRNFVTGRRLAEWCVAISVIPVAVAIYQMVADVYGWW